MNTECNGISGQHIGFIKRRIKLVLNYFCKMAQWLEHVRQHRALLFAKAASVMRLSPRSRDPSLGTSPRPRCTLGSTQPPLAQRLRSAPLHSATVAAGASIGTPLSDRITPLQGASLGAGPQQSHLSYVVIG
jgi:hypothetical protein